MSRNMIIKFSVLASCLLFGATGVQADTHRLKIALASEPTAVDPHYHQATPNIAAASHMFEPLTYPDANMVLQPKLATSWKTLDDNTWVFNLRKGVTFSNGSPFTAKDVIFTFCRTLNNESSISGGYADIVRRMVSVTAQDDYTLVIKTNTPYPLLPEDVGLLPIIWSGMTESKNLRFDPEHKCGVTGTWPSVNDFNSGKVTIGTGPYVMDSYTKGGSLELHANSTYWGGRPEWDQVSFSTIPTSAPRVTGLISGSYDVVENVAGRDIKKITEQGFLFTRTPSVRVIVLELDGGRDKSPQVSSSLGKNPLQDRRVREALSMAIDRETIVKRVLDDAGVPAYQYLPDGMFGALPKAPVTPYDPAAAKKLLAEAGYPNGFELTLTGPNDRYIADAAVLQTIAQYFNRIGVKTKVDSMTRSVFFPRRQQLEFSASLIGWASGSGEASYYLRYWTVSRQPDLGFGSENIYNVVNPAFDKVFLEAIRTMDSAAREKLLQQSVSLAIDNVAQIPLHFESSTWAHRQGLSYEGRRDQRTSAMSVHRN